MLEVIGFGGEITANEKPMSLFAARDESASNPEAMDYEHYGTRHRSMFRLIEKCPGAVGFVISQDGDVRAIRKLDGRVLLWDNIQITAGFPLKFELNRHRSKQI